MAVYTDQTGIQIELLKPPGRIISLVPSQTELLWNLGLQDEVVGITKFCVHPPEWFHTKPRIGGTKQVNAELIHQLRPDLIIANKEENVKEQVQELANHYPVWTSNVNNLSDAYEMISKIGTIVQKTDLAKQLISDIT